jgi:hypothetical protein
METKQIEKSNARLKMEELVSHYVKDNYRVLNKINENVDSNFHKDIKKDWDNLDWFLNDVADKCGFDSTYLLETKVDEREGKVITIYKVNTKFIRATFVNFATPIEFDFVSLKKKRVVTYEYEVIG